MDALKSEKIGKVFLCSNIAHIIGDMKVKYVIF